jgi:hypothetical protein
MKRKSKKEETTGNLLTAGFRLWSSISCATLSIKLEQPRRQQGHENSVMRFLISGCYHQPDPKGSDGDLTKCSASTRMHLQAAVTV